jgi:uncharacterized cofD-like protein
MAAALVGAVGRVLPATSVPVVLKADVAGTEVLGQVNVSSAPGRISAVSIVPPDAPAPGEVIEAIAGADQVIIGPGSLFSSVLAACVVPEVRSALSARTGGRIYIANLRPQPPETAGFDELDCLQAVLAHDIPVDVMVKKVGTPGPQVPVRMVAADVGRPEGHDPVGLAAVLRQLT